MSSKKVTRAYKYTYLIKDLIKTQHQYIYNDIIFKRYLYNTVIIAIYIIA